MPALLITHPCFVEHDTGPGHPERPDRMRAIDKALEHEMFQDLKREEAPLRDDVEERILLAHPKRYLDSIKAARPEEGEPPVRLDPDTVLSSKSWEPALRAVGAGLYAVDQVMNPEAGIRKVFCQVRPCGHHAERERAMAAYDEQVARYRQTVLGAFQETEDALALLRVLESEVQAQREVVALAEENENLVTNRYRAGMVSYLEVAVAQNTTLSARRTLLDLEGSRLQASVQLMAALGGGWDGNLQPAAKASPPEGEGTPAQPASSG